MISYELALQLKEAGFPGSEEWVRGNERGFSAEIMVVDCSGGVMNAPLLSDLIEACGKRFGNMILRKDGMWEVADWHLNHRSIICEGSTPEEAVARLYLALCNR